MDISDLLVTADLHTWALAALTVSLRADDPERSAAGRRLIEAMDLGPLPEAASRSAVAAQAESTLRQATAAASSATSWDDLPDEVLVLQGEASAQAAPAFAQFVLPQLDGLSERLASPGATMLDVGTGIGALAAAYAQVFPQLTVTGIDRSQRVLDLATQRLAAQGVERVQVRCQSITELQDEEAYDLAWVPAPFLAREPLTVGLERCLQALRTGGWLMLGHSKGHGDPVQEALNAFKTLTLGGTVLLEPEAVDLLGSLGYIQVSTLPSPPGAPGITVGRRPER